LDPVGALEHVWEHDGCPHGVFERCGDERRLHAGIGSQKEVVCGLNRHRLIHDDRRADEELGLSDRKNHGIDLRRQQISWVYEEPIVGCGIGFVDDRVRR